jgi:hypothetical protein
MQKKYSKSVDCSHYLEPPTSFHNETSVSCGNQSQQTLRPLIPRRDEPRVLIQRQQRLVDQQADDSGVLIDKSADNSFVTLNRPLTLNLSISTSTTPKNAKDLSTASTNDDDDDDDFLNDQVNSSSSSSISSSRKTSTINEVLNGKHSSALIEPNTHSNNTQTKSSILNADEVRSKHFVNMSLSSSMASSSLPSSLSPVISSSPKLIQQVAVQQSPINNNAHINTLFNQNVYASTPDNNKSAAAAANSKPNQT